MKWIEHTCIIVYYNYFIQVLHSRHKSYIFHELLLLTLLLLLLTYIDYITLLPVFVLSINCYIKL